MTDATHLKLKVIAELSGVIAAVLVLLAIIRVYVHYQYYHLNIIPYLDFSEIILSIFSDLKVLWRLLVMLTGNFLLVPLFWIIVPRYGEKWFDAWKKWINKGQVKVNSEQPQSSTPQNVWARIFSFDKITSPNRTIVSRISLGVLGIIIITISAFRFYNIGSAPIDDITFYFSSVGISFGLFTIIWVAVNHFYKSAIIATLILFFLIFILLGKHDPTLDQQNARSERWTFVTATDTIRTSDLFYMAGRTNHYYFLYNQNDMTTSIISISEMKFSSVRYIKPESNRLRDIIPERIEKFWKK
jgi:hypothetical protein